MNKIPSSPICKVLDIDKTTELSSSRFGVKAIESEGESDQTSQSISLDGLGTVEGLLFIITEASRHKPS